MGQQLTCKLEAVETLILFSWNCFEILDFVFKFFVLNILFTVAALLCFTKKKIETQKGSDCVYAHEVVETLICFSPDFCFQTLI